MDALGRRAAEEAHEDGLGLVAGVVAGGDGAGVVFAGGAEEEVVARVAGGHLEGRAGVSAKGVDVGALGDERDFELGGEIANEAGVFGGGAAAGGVV